MTGWMRRIVALKLTNTERVVGATSLAGVIIFLGLLLDMPTVKRAKGLEAERASLNIEVAGLTVQLDQLAAQRRSAEAEAERLQSAPPDPHASALMREITAIEKQGEVQFVSVRPVPAVGGGTSVAVEINAPLRLLGDYLDDLEQSRWALRIRDLQLARNPNGGPPVSARFVVDTVATVNGFGGVGSAVAAEADDGTP
jgi:cell division protein FtsB